MRVPNSITIPIAEQNRHIRRKNRIRNRYCDLYCSRITSFGTKYFSTLIEIYTKKKFCEISTRERTPKKTPNVVHTKRYTEKCTCIL